MGPCPTAHRGPQTQENPPPGDKAGEGFFLAPQHQLQGQEQQNNRMQKQRLLHSVYRHSVQLSSGS